VVAADARVSTLPEDHWDKAHRSARSSAQGPDYWPKGVQPLTMRGLDLLGIDEKHRLYWDGEEVVVTRRLELTPWQRRLAGAVAVVGVLVGLTELAGYFGFEKAADLGAFLKSLAHPR
jgi:hypothetical protein